MKKLIFAGLLCAMVCVCAPGAAGTVLNVDLPKETLTEREAADRHISTRPEGLKVTRQSVIPWDDAGEQWSILVEMENVSEEAVIIDDTWLIACNAQKEEQARWNVPAIDGAFWKTGRTVQPGGRVVLFAGTDDVRTWVQHPQTHEKTEKTVSPAGLSAFAGKIRRAKFLRVRLEARIDSQTRGHLEKVTDAKAWIEDGKLHLETAEGLDLSGFVSLSVIVSDREGHILDVLQERTEDNESMLNGGTFKAEKELAPYMSQKKTEDVIFQVVGYKFP